MLKEILEKLEKAGEPLLAIQIAAINDRIDNDAKRIEELKEEVKKIGRASCRERVLRLV